MTLETLDTNEQQEITVNPENSDTETLEKVFSDFPKTLVFLNNFSPDIQDLVKNFFNNSQSNDTQLGQGDLKAKFEDFLDKANLNQKLQLKKNLKSCKTEDDVKGVMTGVLGHDIGQSAINQNQGEIDSSLLSSSVQARQAQAQAAEKKDNTERAEVQAAEKKDNTEKVEAQATETEAKTEEDKAKAKEGIVDLDSANRIVNESLELRKDLLKDFPDVAEKTSNKADQLNKELSEATRNQLKERGYDDNFIHNYILLRVTVNEVKDDPRFDADAVKNFDIKVKELSKLDVFLKNIDNECKIADTRLNDLSSENISQTRTELFRDDIGNGGLIDARESNKGSHFKEYDELFKDENVMNTIEKYGKFFPKGAQRYLEEYKKHYENGTLSEYEKTNDCKAFLQALDNVKEKVDDYVQNFIEEMCLMSHIKGMYMCIGENFNLNKAREIKNNDGVLTLNGHVGGIDFSVRQDVRAPKSYLQTNSKIKEDPNGTSFTIGTKENFSNSKYTLPNQEQIFGVVAQRVDIAMKKGGALYSAGNREDFISAMKNDLQNDIVGNMDAVYSDADMAHRYITDKIRGEKIVDNATGLINDINPPETTLPGNIVNNGENGKLFNFMKILNFNIENSTPEEKDKLDKSISRIREIISEFREQSLTNGTKEKDETGGMAENNDGNVDSPDNKNKSRIQIAEGSIAKEYLESSDWKSNGEGNEKGNEELRLLQWDLISDLFCKYSENSPDERVKGGEGVVTKMIIDDLYRDLFTTQKSLASENRDKKNAYNNLARDWPEDSDEQKSKDGATEQPLDEVKGDFA